jgi:hypothetical protein
VQAAPAAKSAVQVPTGKPAQWLPGLQSPGPAQVVRQALAPSHMNGAQLWGVAPQLPEAHCPPGVNVDEAAGHTGGEQDVPSAYFWQPPAPLHFPLVPQLAVLCVGHMPSGSLAPAATFAQVPALPATLQA